MSQFSERAVDPRQYDIGEVRWSEEGHGLNPIRRLFMEKLTPHLGALAGKNVVDIGCGQGWLSDELARRDARVVGIDPSQKNIQAARKQHPGVEFIESDLQSFDGKPGSFDLATSVMVFEHLPDAKEGFQKIRDLLSFRGRQLLITGDFEMFTRMRFGYTVEKEVIDRGKVATRTDYGERAGVIYDIHRTTGRLIGSAAKAGLQLKRFEPITAPGWLVEEHPRYQPTISKPLFHLLDLERQD